MSSVLDITISFGTCVIIRRRYVPVNRTGGVIGSYEKRQLKIYTERGKIFEIKPLTGLVLRAPYPTLSSWLVLTSIRSCQSLTYNEMITFRSSLKQKHGMKRHASWLPVKLKLCQNHLKPNSCVFYSRSSLRRTPLGPSKCVRLKEMSVLLRVN